MKWQDITSPPCFCFLQWWWRMSSKKTESRFVKKVNTHKGCWYHNWQDHDPSLMLSTQMKWQDITSPPWLCFLHWSWRPSCNKPESHFVKRVNTHRVLVPQSTRSSSQFNAEQSNEMARHHPSPRFCFPQQYWKISSNKPESCFVKRVNTRKGCWYHSWQDNDPSLMHTNQQTQFSILL